MSTTPCFAANTLVITSPANGAPVRSGQVLRVSVTATGTYPNGFAIVGGSPMATSEGFQTGLQSNVLHCNPVKRQCRSFRDHGDRFYVLGHINSVNRVRVDVEKADMPQTLAIQPKAMQFSFVGDTLSVDVVGLFFDGTRMLLTSSALLQVSTENPSIAVFQSGWMVAAGPGTTQLTFSVGAASQSISVAVPANARGDLNGDGRVDKSDVQRQVSTRGKIAQVPVGGVSGEVLEHEVKAAVILFFSLLDERQRRLFAGLEALKIGRGGDARVASLLGVDPHTVAKERIELGEDVDPTRVRKPGVGRKAAKKNSAIKTRIEEILRDEVAGDPVDGTRRTAAGCAVRLVHEQAGTIAKEIRARQGNPLCGQGKTLASADLLLYGRPCCNREQRSGTVSTNCRVGEERVICLPDPMQAANVQQRCIA